MRRPKRRPPISSPWATLTLTNRGAVALPAKLRRAAGLEANDPLVAETTPERLPLRPAISSVRVVPRALPVQQAQREVRAAYPRSRCRGRRATFRPSCARR